MDKQQYARLAAMYPFIIVWGNQMGSFAYYIKAQLLKAEATDAPRTAIYERDGVWHTIESINEDNRQGYIAHLKDQALAIVHNINKHSKK